MANITKVYLLNVPIDKNYNHTFYFANKDEQYNYFVSKVIANGSFDNFSYQRKNNSIRVPIHVDEIKNANYVMYQNTSYNNAYWYYAFIDDLMYINDENTEIKISTDVLQTYLYNDYFNVKVNQCFVEREHVKDDTIGLHTVPERVELGDYVINSKNRNNSLLVFSFIIGCTVDLNNDFADVEGGLYQGVYSGIKYYKMLHDDLNKVIKALAQKGKSDAIVCIFACPSLFVSSTVPEGGTYSEVETGTTVVKKNWVCTLGIEETNNYKPTKLNGYTPKNNKLLTYPYTYMLMSNNSGGSAVYKYELFNNEEDTNLCDFYIYSSVTPSMSIKLVPLYYNGVGANHDEGLTLGKFPVCAWNTDVYTNWLTQNGVNIGLSILSSGATMVSGAVLASTGAGAMVGASTFVSGALGVANTLGEVYSHSLQPPQIEGNVNNGDVTFSSGNLTFTALQMSIKKEYAQIIDNYFDMYGYKVNVVKEPNTNHRKLYWFTKTIDANITGNIPQDDLEKIKSCYNKGITFWKDPNYIFKYGRDNSIVS